MYIVLLLMDYESLQSLIYQKLFGISGAFLLTIGIIFDIFVVKTYVACIRKFFNLLKVNQLSLTTQVFKYFFYSLMVILFILRTVINVTSIYFFNVIVFTELSKDNCYYWSKNAFGNLLWKFGWVSDFIPNYGAIVIIYLFYVFGNKNPCAESSMSVLSSSTDYVNMDS
jgi:hypothetical protein